MLHPLIRAAAIFVLFAGTARAQVVPGDSPNMGIGSAVAGSRGIGIISRSRGPIGTDYENERNYREAVKRIPDKKASNDPWKSLRQPAASSADRHRVQ